MTVLTARQVANWWEAEGGPRSRDVEWVAIALGESSLDTGAVSPAGAIGLWQIMPEHAAEYGFQVSGLYDPQVNAYIAVRLSGYGQNCAAWDSAYRDIYSSGRYAYLAYPERGSADWNNLAAVANELGQSSGAGQLPGGPPGIGTELNGAVARWQELGRQQLPALSRYLAAQRHGINRMYTAA